MTTPTTQPAQPPLHTTASFLLRVLALTALFAALTAWLHLKFDKPIGIDDANIFMTYAKHLAQGEGFVYNLNGERVEGFSSMLYVLLQSAFFLFTNHPEQALYLFHCLLLALVFAACTRELDHRANTPIAPESILLIAWIASTPVYMLWTVLTHMESGIWSALILTSAWTGWRIAERGPTPRRTTAACTLVALMLLTRPEAMLFAAWQVLIFSLLLFAQKQPLRIALTPLATYAITLTTLISFRLAYFGYPFPNTYYAKVSPDRIYNLLEGAQYIADFVRSHPTLWLLLPIAALLLLRLLPPAWRRNPRALATLGAIGYLPVLCVVILIVGGDLFPGFRFITPFWPLMILPALVLLQRLPLRTRWITLLPILLILPFGAHVRWDNVLRQQPADFQLMFNMAVSGRNNGRQLNHTFAPIPQPPSVGVVATGGIGFAYTGEVVDLMGLNNTAMAHAPGDRKGLKAHSAFHTETFFQLQPDLVLPRWNNNPGPQSMLNHWANTVALKDLLRDPKFQTKYRLISLEPNTTSGYRYFHAYARTTLLPTLQQLGTLQQWPANQ